MGKLRQDWKQLEGHANDALKCILHLKKLLDDAKFADAKHKEYLTTLLMHAHAEIRGMMMAFSDHVRIDEGIEERFGRVEIEIQAMVEQGHIHQHSALNYQAVGRFLSALRTEFKKVRDEFEFVYVCASRLFDHFIRRRFFDRNELQQIQMFAYAIFSGDSKHEAQRLVKELGHHVKYMYYELHEGRKSSEWVERMFAETIDALSRIPSDLPVAESDVEKIRKAV